MVKAVYKMPNWLTHD